MNFKPNTDQTKERVAETLRGHCLLSMTAFTNLVYDDIRTNHQGDFSERNILASARRNGVPSDEEIWGEAFSGFEDFDCQATRSLLLACSQLPVNSTNLANELHRRLRDDPGSLALRPEAYAKQQAAQHRRSLINSISASGKHTTYPVWANAYGTFKWLSCESLANESNEMLLVLSQRVPEWRKQIVGERIEKQITRENDSLGELNTRPERVELENDEFLQFPGSNPPREYSVSEAKSHLRELLFLPNSSQSRGPRRVAALNRLLAGKRYGE